MATYKVTFTPQGPWFFGSEKGFRFPGQENAYRNSYFIKSEFMPSQSTILGALRYILIPVKKPLKDFDTEENKEYIGEASFNIDSVGVQDFGKIKRISPVFIIKNGKTLIAAPMDHKAKGKADKKNNAPEKYDAFSQYETVITPGGERFYTDEYNIKIGVFNGFAELETGEVYHQSAVFGSNTRVGNKRFAGDKGFFKKEYCYFKDEKDESPSSFAVFAQIDMDGLDETKHTVALGQGKSIFVVAFEKSSDDLEDRVSNFLIKHHKPFGYPEKITFNYCLSDVFVNVDPYDDTLFAVTMTKDYRSFMTQKHGKVQKDEVLRRMLRAGSVVIVKDKKWTSRLQNENAQQIGFNRIVSIELNNGGNENE